MKQTCWLAALSLAAMMLSCKKETSLETDSNGTIAGTAAFTLAGAPGSCLAVVTDGRYIAGTLLDSTNAVRINVEVATPGTYHISSGTADGMVFNASGTFTTTGEQTIVLIGSGRPFAAGTFDFTLGNSGCSFPVTVDSVTADHYVYYFQLIIDGVTYRQQVTDDNGYIAGSSAAGGLGSGENEYFGSDIAPDNEGEGGVVLNKMEMDVYKGLFYNYDYFSTTNAAFKTFFNPGSYSYAAAIGDEGIVIDWRDSSGTVWSTYAGAGTQAGSYFTISKVEDLPSFNDYYIQVTAAFGCTLYDGTGNEKIVTNGEYVGAFGKLE